MNKRGQEGGAAALVALIGLFMVLYILFLPPAERSKLLGEEQVTVEKELPSLELLVTNPGRLLPKGEMTAVHPLPSITLATTVEGVVLDTWNSLSIRRSLFTATTPEVHFSLADPENIENVLLNFIIAGGKGVLDIMFNGERVFSGEITSRHIEPISIKKALLRKENTLSFSVSAPAPWRSHFYTLSSITLHGDLVDKTRQRAQSVFYLDEEEKKLMSRAVLSFTAICDPLAASSMDITLNGNTIFEGALQCNLPSRIEVPLDMFQRSTNTITWQSNGRYKLDLIRLETALKEPQNYRAYFSITPEQYDYAYAHDLPILATLRVVGNEKPKGRMFVNQYVVPFDAASPEFLADITDFVRRGYNLIELDPQEAFEVQELRIEIGQE